MDLQTAKNVGEKAQGLKEWFKNEYTARVFAEYLEGWIIGTNRNVFHLNTFEDMKLIAGILGLQSSVEHEVVALYFQNTVVTNHYLVDTEPLLRVKGENAVNDALEIASDIGISGDFNCDYEAGVAIAIDDEHVAVFVRESTEDVYTCDDCRDQNPLGVDGLFNCEHEESTFSVIPKWMLVCRKEQVKDIAWGNGELVIEQNSTS